jgi:hypothetical protein
MESGFAVSFELKYRDLLPSAAQHGIKIVSPYAICCYWCLMYARIWANRNNYQGDIAYFFESGHASQGEANRIMNDIFLVDELRSFYRYASHTFADKRKVLPLQTGDILAWQWRKNVKERIAGNMKPRADLLSLLEKEHLTTHFGESMLLDFRNVIAQGPQG